MKITASVTLAVFARFCLACSGDNQIRCVGRGENDLYDYWKQTEECKSELGNSATCYCYRRARYFVVAEDNLDDFAYCCYRKGLTSIEC